ncbi:MAG: cytochrome c-type biogenesis protein [Dongiaceae bacterium]
MTLAAAVLSIGAGVGNAVEPNEMLADPALEARAREISRGLRCLVCQNESIDESQAELARDLRLLVRERLAGGDSDEQVVQFIVDRYGDFVLLRPPLKPATYPLWAAPVVLLAIAAAILAAYLRRHRRGAPQSPPLSAEERARVDELLKADREP